MTAPRAESLMRLEQEVGVLIRRVRRLIHERAAAVHPDLQPAAYLLLAHLADVGPARASSVADLFHIDKGAVSRQVSHLVELGLVERTPDPDDGRASLLSASPDAVARLDDMHVKRREWLSERLAGWNEDDLDTLAVVMGRYNDALGMG
ncbi:MarR family winged helix-turn-helix transcriptional regulator [Nocardioides acrostichi]|uniref:MarR family transcriptional regulator n=1 Tax=Nocardioides acrostichi TaxID=2784339 RepID=A0A930V4J8_9ACTN|nr:MarR family transcriptional regulator [Nocardioides acrostichi]MBF4163620.1 MarR family transcriptional regulator [Nocardioides acrostichi]